MVKSHMEKRRGRRVSVSLSAERISGDSKHSIFIENLSENGICIIATPSKKTASFKPGAQVTVRLKLSSDITINLDCIVIWSHKSEPNGITVSVGLEIIDPPEKYKAFVKKLP